MAEKRTKSKRYAGVYILQQKDKDVSYSILYKNFEGKNQRETIGLKSEGITELFAYNKRIERISKAKHGVDLRVQKKKGSIEFSEVWELYVENKALSDNIRKDYRGRWKKHMVQDFSQTVTMEKLIAFRKRLENLKRPLSPRSIDMMIGMLGSATRYWNSRPNNHLKVYDAVTDLRVYDKCLATAMCEHSRLATAMCEHSQKIAIELGYKAMQFNFVASSNIGAIRLWNKLGFETVGHLPKAFNHPTQGYIDALVMYKWFQT